MNWQSKHRASEKAAAAAHSARLSGDSSGARSFFEHAASLEREALADLAAEDKPRTFGIIGVSAVALSYKAGELRAAEQLAHSLLSRSELPEFAAHQLRELLQTVWNEQTLKATGLVFASSQVTVSVDGGAIVRGGAPLDLIVERVQTVQAIFYRTTEYLRQIPLRRRGPAPRPIQEMCRPWLLQSVPGSYQFTVAIENPAQGVLFEEGSVEPSLVADTFMAILHSAALDPDSALPKVVPDAEYRSTFLRLARNLAPSGDAFTQLEVRSSQGAPPVHMTRESRRALSRTIRGSTVNALDPVAVEQVELVGVLRAVHLDKDWLELSVDGQTMLRIGDVGDAVDDVIGPMVNHRVVVHASRSRSTNKYSYQDIELSEQPARGGGQQVGRTDGGSSVNDA